MGNDASRRAYGRQSFNNSTPTVMNNHNPLKFHAVHGEHVTLSNNDTVARRFEGFCKGIVFSHRPVAINEYVYIKFLDISTSWSGALRIGFTSNDPSTYRNRLPKYACPFLTESDGNWARALAERLVKEDSILFYYITSEGDVHYGFDNVERGIFFGGVNVSGKLWALLDIYGNTVEIQFLNPQNLYGESRNEQLESASSTESLSLVRPSLDPDTPQPVYPVISLHEVCGKDVQLLDSYFYQKLLNNDNGYAFTSRPLKVKEIVMMHLFNIDSSEAYLTYGVTSCNPSEVRKELPDDPDDLLDRPEYWVVQRISAVSSEDVIFFVIEEDGALTFLKNYDPLITAAYVDHNLPLWFFFNLCKSKGRIALCGSYEGQIQDCVRSKEMENLGKNYAANCVSPTGKTLHNSDSSYNESANECVICMEAPRDCALYRCGHACMCYDCAQQLRQSENPQCPVCRVDIEDVLKIYK